MPTRIPNRAQWLLALAPAWLLLAASAHAAPQRQDVPPAPQESSPKTSPAPPGTSSARRPSPTQEAEELKRRLRQAQDPATEKALREKLHKAWIAAAPMSAQVLLKQAGRAQAAGLVNTAEELLRLAARRWPDYAEARFRLAWLLWQTGRDAAALRQLDALLQRQPDHFPALSLKVRLLLQNEQPAQALKACASLRRLYPHWRQMRQRCERLQWRVGQDA